MSPGAASSNVARWPPASAPCTTRASAPASAAATASGGVVTVTHTAAPAHRDAVAADSDTALTRAFTGRTARGIINRWMREHDVDAPSAYPDVHHVTSKIRAAARTAGDPDGFHLWAGQAHALARDEAAGVLVARLWDEARRSLRRTSTAWRASASSQ